MTKTRSQVQDEAFQTLQYYDYNGTIVLGTGVGKSKVAIECIKQGNFKNILITSPRTNLKESWREQLDKWFPNWKSDTEAITIENIQTAYKRSPKMMRGFNLVIVDEAHTIRNEYIAYLQIANELNIPVICLTATPNEEDEFKKTVLYSLFPIVYSYTEAEKDSIVNKCRYIIYEYELTDDYKVLAGPKSKQWLVGEKTQYGYIEKVFNDTSEGIKKIYFEDLRNKILNRIERNSNLIGGILTKEEIYFLEDSISKDLSYFYEVTKPRYDDSDMSPQLYYALKDCKGINYSILGTQAIKFLSMNIPADVKSLISKYNWALGARKSFLCSLSSSADIANKLKKIILDKSKSNKILLFSELTNQSSKLSPYVVHSKSELTTKDSALLNTLNLQDFNNGKIRELASCQSLTLGLNLTGANWAIFESYYGSKVSATQKKGRMNRLGINDVANIIIIKPKNTQMEVWFDKAFEFVTEYEFINSMEELQI